MAANINLSNFLNSLTGNNGIGNVYANNNANGEVNAAQLKNAIEQIKNMLIGDIFTGEVMGFNGSEVSVRLGSGELFNANILLENGQFDFNKGDMVTFLVDGKTDSSVSLKPLDVNAQEMYFANKALEASNLAMNKENLDMIKGLIDLNMPIDKNTLNEVSRLLSKFPDASLDTVLRLYKLDIPVTQDNITQFEAYKLYEHDMTGTLNNLSEDFSALISQLNNQGNSEAAVNLAKELVDIFLNNMNFPNQTENATEIESFLKTLPQNTDEQYKAVMDFVNKSAGSDSEKLQLLKNIMNNPDFPPQLSEKLVGGKEFQDLFSKVMKENFFISPEDVAEKKDVKEFYERLVKVASESETVLQKAGLADSDMAKGMHSVKSNLQFMNDLNHNMAFMQIPIKLQQGEARGDLYVYTNKKSLAGKTDELTALLHLDMEHLGPLDVYVKMTNGNNVSTNFCLESEEMLDFIYEHIDILTKRLNDKGYNFNPTMTVKDAAGNEGKTGDVDFVKDFLDVTQPVIPVSRYLFDTKA